MNLLEEFAERHRQEKLNYPILPSMTDDEIEMQIRRRLKRWIEKRNELAGHLIGYVAVNLFLWGMWITLWSSGSSFPWPAFVTFFWGLGLFGHFVETIGQSPAAIAKREANIKRAVQQEKERLGLYEKPKREQVERPHRAPAVSISDDGELVPDDEFDDHPEIKPARRAEKRNY